MDRIPYSNLSKSENGTFNEQQNEKVNDNVCVQWINFIPPWDRFNKVVQMFYMSTHGPVSLMRKTGVY